MKGSVRMERENGRRPGSIVMRRGLALLFAGCVLTCALTACGNDKGKDKDKDSSGTGASGTSSVIPLNTPSPTPQPTAKVVKVEVDDSLNVRENGSTDSNILGTVKNGDELALLTDTEQSGWYQVSYNGGTGYVAAEFVKVIDVTVERYNDLKNSSVPTPTPEPSADPEATPTPAPGNNTGSQAGNNASSDGEDGE